MQMWYVRMPEGFPDSRSVMTAQFQRLATQGRRMQRSLCSSSTGPARPGAQEPLSVHLALSRRKRRKRG